jgi:surface protein
MKKLAFLLLIVFTFFGEKSYSQTCTPVACPSSPIVEVFGGLCDTAISDGRVNDVYSDDVSFFINGACFDAGIIDPSQSGTVVRINRINNFSFQGLPSGISAGTSATAYNIAANATVAGCLWVAGTPLQAGVFSVNVRFDVRVVVCAFTFITITETVDYPLEFIVLPDPSFNGLLASYNTTDAPATLTPTGTTGGTFSGPGVSGTTFNPALAGPGIHTIKYIVTAQQGTAIAPTTDSSEFVVEVFGISCVDYFDTLYTSTCDPLDAGTSVQNLSTIDGCDSIITTITALNSSYNIMVQGGTICSSYGEGDTIITILSTINGCDSIINTVILQIPSYNISVVNTTCNPNQDNEINGFTASNGCDSIVFVSYTLLPSDNIVFEFTSCNPADTGIVVQSFTKSNGCDSTITTITSLSPSYDLIFNEITCIQGEEGTEVQNLSTINGCDSIITKITTLKPSYNITITGTICSSYGDSDSTVQVLSTVDGCDSIITTIITQIPSYNIFVTLPTCNPNQDNEINGFTASNGCDSIVFTNYALAPKFNDTIYTTSCNPDNVGIKTDSLLTLFNCDSIVTINTILSSNCGSPYITVWKTDNPGTSASNQITIPGTGTNYIIEWEEVGNPSNRGDAVGNNSTTVTFPTSGTYRVYIRPGNGTFNRISFNNGGDRRKLLNIEQWGDIEWSSFEGAYASCQNLSISATDIPSLSNVSSMLSAFFGCTSLTTIPNINNWDVSNVNFMSYMFAEASSFNSPIGNWNISNVDDMEYMLYEASSFNQNLGGWQFKPGVNTNFTFLFTGLDCINYGNSLKGWAANPNSPNNITIEINAQYGTGAVGARNTLGGKGWLIFDDGLDPACIELDAAFFATAYTTVWKTDNPGTSANNQIIIPATGSNYFIYWENESNPMINGNTTGSGSTTLTFPAVGNYRVFISPGNGTFNRISFNNGGDRRKILNIEQWGDIAWSSFEGAYASCQNLTITATDIPNLSNVSSMLSAFFGCTSLTTIPNINNWDVSNVNFMSYMFAEASSFNSPIGNWNISNVDDMEYMLYEASSFNQNLGGWQFKPGVNTNFTFLFTGLDCINYGNSLKGWAANPNSPNNITIEINAQYGTGAVGARNTLGGKGWLIFDDGLESNCPCDAEYDTIYTTSCNPFFVGTSTDSLSTIYGCDSVITTITTLLPSVSETVNLTSCNPADVGTVIDTLVAANGCDSIITTITSLHIIEPVTCPSDSIVCELGEELFLEGFDIFPPSVDINSAFSGPGVIAADSASGLWDFYPDIAGFGTHVITYSYTDSNGCVSSCTFNIIVQFPSDTTIYQTSCNPNDTGSVVLSQCNSTITTITTLNPSFDITINETTCIFSQAGTVIDSLLSNDGCDSIVTTVTTLLPSVSETVNLTSCDPAEVGTVVDTLVAANGCDSVVTTITTLLPSYSITVNQTTCIFSQAGTVIDSLTSSDGCDSIVTVVTTALLVEPTEITLYSCNVSDTGTIFTLLSAVNGCDSLVITQTLLLPSASETVNLTSCNPDDVGTVVDTLVATNGCDSILTTITTLSPSYDITINATSCDPADTGTVVQNLTSVDACDSIITTITTLSPSYDITINATSCDPADTGTVVQNLTSIDACDSIVTTITTLLPSVSETVNLTTCDPSQDGTTIDTLVATNGCDSIVTTITTLLQSSDTTITIVSCNVSQAGTVVDTFTSTNGCDSIVTIITSALPVDEEINNQSTCNPAEAGSNSIMLFSTDGCDSILVTTITTLNTSYNIVINETTCDALEAGTIIDSFTTVLGCDSIITTITNLLQPEFATVNNLTCNAALVGTKIDTIPGGAANGCDRIVTTNTSLQTYPAPPTAPAQTICYGTTATLTATVNFGFTRRWYSDPAATVQVGTGTTYTTPTLFASTTYNVRARDLLGNLSCPTAIPITVIKPEAPIVPDTVKICVNGGSTQITASSQTPGSSFRWYNSEIAGTLLANTNPFTTPVINSTTIYWVSSVEPIKGCESTRSQVIVSPSIIITPPTRPDTFVCSGLPLTLTAISNNNPSGTIKWYDITGGNLIFTGNPYQTPIINEDKSYRVSETVNGCESLKNIFTIIAFQLPPEPSIGDTAICINTSGTLTVTGSGGTISWYADPSGLELLNIGNTFITPILNSPTTYYVQETGVNGCKCPLKPVNVSVITLPTPTGNNAVICTGTTGTINVNSLASGTINWYNNPSKTQLIGTGNSLNIGPFSTAGNYSYYATFSDGVCESNAKEIIVSVIQGPNNLPILFANKNPVCSLENITLFASNFSIGASITWFSDASLSTTIGTGNPFIPSFPIASNTIIYARETLNGCNGPTVFIDITVDNPMPLVSPTSICSGNVAELVATSNGGQITWYSDVSATNQVGIGNSYTTPILTSSTSYYVREVSSINCQGPIIEVPITVKPTPTPTIINITTCISGQESITNDTLTGKNGCDSIITTIKTFDSFASSILFNTTCDVSEEGTSIDTLFGAANGGCDSIITTITKLLPTATNIINLVTCIPGQEGVIIDTLFGQAANGCDSIVTTISTLEDFLSSVIYATTCIPEEEGITIDTLTSTTSNGCDSIITTVTTLLPNSTNTIFTTTCIENLAGTFIDTLFGQAANGCDSIVTTIVDFLPSTFDTIYATTCLPDEAGINSIIYQGFATNGCDSIVTTVTTLLPTKYITINETTCNSDESGTFTDTLVSNNGCDSIITTVVDLLPTSYHTINFTTCIPNEAGTIVDTLVGGAANGCDSIITTITSLLPTATSTVNETTCISGEEGTEVYLIPGGAVNGCDSIITVITTLLEPEYATVYNSTCIEAEAGTRVVVIPGGAANGCDRIVTTITTFLGTVATPNAPPQTICAGKTATLSVTGNTLLGRRWYSDAAATIQISASATYTTPILFNSTTYYVRLRNGLTGCLSPIVAVPVTVKPVKTNTINLTTCNPAEAGTVVTTLTGINGCDSIVTRITTLLPTAISTINLTTCVPGQEGTTLDTLVGQAVNGCDSIVTIIKTLDTYASSIVNLTTCDPNSAGTTIDTLVGGAAAGCDSIITTFTRLLNPETKTINLTTCFPQLENTSIDTLVGQALNGCDSIITTIITYVPNATTINLITCDTSLVGTKIDTIFGGSSIGCDSIITTITNLGTPIFTTINETTCFEDEDGVIIDSLISSNGCDSIVTTIITLLLPERVTNFVGTCNPNAVGTVIDTIFGGAQNGCDRIVTTVTSLLGKPNAPNASGVSICSGNSVTLTSTVDFLLQTRWFSDLEGLNQIGTGSNYTTPVLDTTTTYYVRSRNGLTTCLSDPVAVKVVVIPVPLAPAIEDTIKICTNGGVAQLTASSTTQSATFRWFNAETNGTLISTSNPYTTGFINSETSYWVSAIDSTGTCESLTRSKVVVSPTKVILPPTVDNTEICAGQSVTLEASSNNTPSGVINWYNSTETTLLQSGNFYNTGIINGTTSYKVSEIINGCESDKYSFTVSLLDRPSTPSINDTSICINTSVTLTAIGSGGLITWFSSGLGNDSLSSGDSYTTPVLNSQTTYVYIETSEDGCKSLPGTVTVNMISLPNKPIVENITLCVGVDSVLSVSNNNQGIINWYSDIDKTNLIGSQNSINVGPYSTEGVYKFYVAVFDGNCESDADEVLVTVVASPNDTIKLNANQNPICVDGLISLNATNTTEGSTVTWYFDPGLTLALGTGYTFNPGFPIQSDITFYAQESLNNCFGPPVFVEIKTKIADSVLVLLNSCIAGDTGTTVTTLSSLGGCDSIVTTITSLLPSYTITVNETTCASSQAGTTIDSLLSMDGCDSVITTITTLLLSEENIVNLTSCNPQDTGSITLVLQDANSCDSIVTIITTLLPSYSITVNQTTCIFSQAGTVIDSLTSSDGCDSIVTVITTPLLVVPTEITLYSCNVSDTGTIFTLLSAANGCDSLVITETLLLPSVSETVNLTSCDPADIGTVVDTLVAANGCDSVVTTITTLRPSTSSTLNLTSCDPADVGTVVNTLTGSNGCDSVVTTITTLRPSTSSIVNLTSCDPADVGTVVNTLAGSNGCDSVVTTITTLRPSTSSTVNLTSCDPADVGTVVNTLVASNGCDSIVTTITTLLNAIQITCPSDSIICDQSEELFLEGFNVWPPSVDINSSFSGPGVVAADSASGLWDFYPDIAGFGIHEITYSFTDSSGCVSSCTFNIIIQFPTDTTLYQTSCNPNDTGTVVVFQCNSTITTITTLSPSTSQTVNLITCEPSEVGTIVIVLEAANGCDSVVTTITTIGEDCEACDTIRVTVETTTCVESEVGTTIETFTAANGCDSIVTTITTLLPSYIITFYNFNCDISDSITNIVNLTTLGGCDSILVYVESPQDRYDIGLWVSTCNPNDTGVVVQSFESIYGCDSIVTTITTLLPSASQTVNLTTCEPSEVGTVVTVLEAANGCDSVVTTITTIGEDCEACDTIRINLETTTCVESEVGTTIERFTAANGCDSVVTTITTLGEDCEACDTIRITLETTTCIESEVGTTIETFTAANGCDSIVTTITTLLPSTSQTVNLTTCDTK